MAVFISYAQGTEEHKDRVLKFAERLRSDSVDAVLDRWEEPEEGWENWMHRQIDSADFVLCVCDENYYRRVMGREERGTGLGVSLEATIILRKIYRAGTKNKKFLPVLLSAEDEQYIPDALVGSYYRVETEEGYEALLRRIRGERLVKPPLGKSPQQTKALAQPWNVAYARNPWFTGREKEIEELRKTLEGKTAAAVTQAAGISGLGGIGKTQTAAEYAYRYRAEYRAVLWTRADTEQGLASGFGEIARALDLPEKDAQDQKEIAAAVKRWLEENEGWLLVFDNADDPALVKPYFPVQKKGHILLTSRARRFDALGMGRPVELEVLGEEEAARFLLERTETKKTAEAEREARELAEELGRLPLALEQAAAYMVANETRIDSYRVSYRKRRLELLGKGRAVAGEYPESVLTTWAMNFAEVEKSPASADVLRVSAFLAPEEIPEELLVKGAAKLGGQVAGALAGAEQDPVRLDELLEPLGRYSLVRRDREKRTYSMHRLVQAVVRERMSKQERREWAERAVEAVNAAFPNEVEFRQWPECERLVGHALEGARLIDEWRIETPAAGRLLNRAGIYLEERARYAEAEPLFRRALATGEKVLGPEHPDVATYLNNLALLLTDQGRYLEAEPLYRRAIAIGEKALGPEHPDVVSRLNNLALLLTDQGRYGEAEPLYQRALEIGERTLGPEHHAIAKRLNNLALLLREQGRYGEAEPLNRRALAISEKALGPEHPDVATALNNLAELLRAQGRYGEAEPLHQRALEIGEKTLGPEHHAIAKRLNNLALLLTDQGRYGEAEPLYQRALAILEKTLGPEHPDVALALENYAGLLRKTGREAEAAEMRKRAAAIREAHARRNRATPP